MINLSVRSNVKDLQKSLTSLAQKQVPFATATALTALAKMVQTAEVQQLRATLKNPGPFTTKSVGMTAARKNVLIATVFVKPLAAQYLEPYEAGGVHKLSSKALLNPKDIKLNQYGQLSKGTLAALKARPDIFIGPVKTAKGMVNGVWQRVTDTKRVTLLNAKGKKLRGLNKATKDSNGNAVDRLKLLIRFGDALPVAKHLGYQDRARSIVSANFNPEFKKALAQAMATAK